MGTEENIALMADGMMTINQVCEFANLSKTTVYRLMDSGKLKYCKAGTRRLIPRKAIVLMLSESVVGE